MEAANDAATRARAALGRVRRVLVVWQLLTMASGSKFFPTPVSIVEAGAGLWFGGPASQLGLHDKCSRTSCPASAGC
ncbi:hypothetical protein [Kibdelosporangium philippinense]|uniref:hypothetical protein n=1 Tax=Kibdelosporangium philippinense TaxID=211113 RepID=UPI00361337F7